MTLIITLILIGTAALMLELFIPGGIVGTLGALCLLAAIVTTFSEYGVNAGLLVSLGILLTTTIAFFYWMKYFDRLPGMKNLILTEASAKDSKAQDQHQLIGQSGSCLTDLLPSGKALISGQKLDVIAESGFINKSTDITVVEADGSKIIVRAKKL